MQAASRRRRPASTWGSGARNADLVSAGCLLIGDDGKPVLLDDGAPRVLSVVLQRSLVHLLDNWDAFGLCGTGSGEFEVRDAFVPLVHSASLFDGPRIQTPLYRFPVFGLLAIAIAAVATGLAREALASFISDASRSAPQASIKPLSSRATVQEAVARGDLRLSATHAVQTSAEVVIRLYTLAGGGAVFSASPLQRALRNVQVATQHMTVNDATYGLTGRLLLGLPTQTNTL